MLRPTSVHVMDSPTVEEHTQLQSWLASVNDHMVLLQLTEQVEVGDDSNALMDRDDNLV